MENNTVEVFRRDTKEKETRSLDGIEQYVRDLMSDIQSNIYKKALDYRSSVTRKLILMMNLRKK